MQGCALSTFFEPLQMQKKQTKKRNFMICHYKALKKKTGSENYLMKNCHG